MSDKEIEVQLKEDEAEKVSGGVAFIIAELQKAADPLMRDDEESDQQNIVGYGRHI